MPTATAPQLCSDLAALARSTRHSFSCRHWRAHLVNSVSFIAAPGEPKFHPIAHPPPPAA
eukprot:1304139-Alexandrium_andersonii.AAC.1